MFFPAFTPVSIGVELTADTPSGLLRVVTPIKDSPAHRAGIRTGDLLSRLVCESNRPKEDPPKVLCARGLSVAAASQALLGKPGTRVTLTLFRADLTKPMHFEMTRGRCLTEVVFGVRRKADASWDFMLDRQRKIGYLRVGELQRRTPQEIEAALIGLERQGLKGLVLDLRFSPGGLCGAASAIADLFVKDGVLFSVRSRTAEYREEGKAEGSHLNFPLVCLVNRETTRMSELIAACLQDHKRAVLVGERTPGECEIRNVLPLGGGELYITGAVPCRAGGKNFSRILSSGRPEEDWGVRPDSGFALRLPDAEHAQLAKHLRSQRILPSGPAPVPTFKDRQLELALKYLRKVR